MFQNEKNITQKFDKMFEFYSKYAIIYLSLSYISSHKIIILTSVKRYLKTISEEKIIFHTTNYIITFEPILYFIILVYF